jgi:hypothetical protein
VLKKGVASAVIAMKLISLAKTLEHRLGAVDLICVGVLVVVAKQPKDRTAKTLAEIDGSHRPLGVELTLVVDDHVATPAVDDGVDRRESTGTKIGVATT